MLTEADNEQLERNVARGSSLAELLKHGPLEATRAIAILRQLCDRLEHAHRAGLVHRDLEPANIVIERDAGGGEVTKIIGTAIADDASERQTRSGPVVGTPAYLAPEQATAGKLDHRCDQYALGVIAYEMLAGALPGAEVAPAGAGKADALLQAIVRKMLANRPDDRFTNVRAVKQVLELLASDRNRAAALLGMPVAEHAIPAQRRTPVAVPIVAKPRSWWPWLAGGIVGVIAGAIVLAVAWPAADDAVHRAPVTSPASDPTTPQLIDRYQQVGQQLQQATAGVDAQTRRYRTINIVEALRTPGSRREAMRVLDEIARALP